jgi:hypothetical protein
MWASDAGGQTIFYIEIAEEDRQPSDCFNFYVGVGGDGSLASAEVTPPGEPPIPLVGPDASNEFEFQSPCFPSLASLRSSYPLGDYDFEFNGGVGSGGSETTETFAGGLPACFPDITAPTPLSATTPNPTLSWDIVSTCEVGVKMDVVLFDLTLGSEVYGSYDEMPVAGSLSQTGLVANHAYLFAVSTVNRKSEDPPPYEYYDEAYNTSLALFTVPEPGATPMLLAGAALLLALPRRPDRNGT